MNLYLISQEKNNNYDTYNMAVVCAKSSKDAAEIHPSGCKKETWPLNSESYTWCSCPEDVKVTYIGKASSKMKRGVICASFNAG